MKHKNGIALLLSLGLLLAVFANVAAQGSRRGESTATQPAGTVVTPGIIITYQGRLTAASDTPINSSVNIVFKLYDQDDHLVWTSATRTIIPVNGLFTVYLGDSNDPVKIDFNYYAAIGITVGSDAEMTPHQPLNSLVGYNANRAGVAGNSRNGAGVAGNSSSGVGISGYSPLGVGVDGQSTSGVGVYAISESSTQPAISAVNYGGGPALRLQLGGIQVDGAGVDTTTPVFIHKVITGGSGNICTGASHATVISNPLTDMHPDAILMVTPNYRDSDGTLSNPAGPANASPAVFYSVKGRCGAANDNKWVIYNLNSAAMVDNTYYNVMVVLP